MTGALKLLTTTCVWTAVSAQEKRWKEKGKETMTHLVLNAEILKL